MLFQDKLRYELPNTLHVEKLDDVDLVYILFIGALMSFKLFSSLLDALALFETRTAARA